VLLKQAERRLARLQGPAGKTDGNGRAQQDKRLQELEQKVEALLKEIHNLRRERQGEKPQAPGAKPNKDEKH
jgi:cell division protein FtsB